MIIERRAPTLLKVFLLLLFGILVVFQTLSLPGQFAYMAEETPEDAHLRWPFTVMAVLWILCVQVVIVSTWKLLTLVERDRIFTDTAMKWVDAIIRSIVAAWLLLVGLFLFVVVNADDPGAPMLLLLMVVSVSVVGLLMIVMRALLRQATTLRTDMDTVI